MENLALYKIKIAVLWLIYSVAGLAAVALMFEPGVIGGTGRGGNNRGLANES